MADIIEHAPALTALVVPTVNSYKRLVHGYETPVYIAWVPLNRSALIRVPMFNDLKSAGFEYRCPAPSCNPYIALISIIIAGVYGIERELELSATVNQNIFNLFPRKLNELGIKTLPGNLFEALSFLKRGKLIQEALGENIFQNLIRIKHKEWFEYSTQITDWDWKKYLNVYQQIN